MEVEEGPVQTTILSIWPPFGLGFHVDLGEDNFSI